ncbi:3-oxoacyl-[acyl-carrier-protein] synthase 1 [Seminavis robusta]|uniref:Nodulation protein E n=1 Tax=Seminavis robusta TaxID=568900 RepID=A0A9N8DWT7_9STRA|nr:3-oxoacyl-[acyl-carrier-protein] synthase 1 [Seminavis robusta]|eukprot:Sro435_g142440.1 3-oxoacyl-[acyl-carrier-protein] synthase 1 (476) ;mRNA; r:59226-60933
MFRNSALLLVLASPLASAFTTPATGSSFVGGSKFAVNSQVPQTPQRASTELCMTATGLRRVVVTGMGIVSCLGNTLEDVTKSLKECEPGISFADEFAELGIRSQVFGKPDLDDADFKELVPKTALRFMGTNAKYAYIAMDRAIQDSGLKPEEYQENPRVAAIIGQGGTSIPDIVETVDAVQSGGKRWKNKVGPFRVTRSMGSTCSAVLATAFKVQGASYSISSACSTGAHCIGTGMEQIQLGKSDIAFCGAGENVNWQFTSMFDCMGALSTSYNDSPKTASRAFDKTRDGFVIAGGGGVVVLEELEHAKARGAKIYAELVGYGANSDGYDMVAPSGVGGQRCMQLAISEAERNAGEKPIEYINTHGTSTPVGDVMELGAIKTLFTEKGYQPNVGSTKSLSGHALGAAGVHETIYTILMMENDFMAESANINDLVDEAEGMNILTERKDGSFKRAMSNSFGFGGTNCALVFDKYEE